MSSTSNFVKVFDVLDSGYKSWTFPAFGLIFVAIGLVVFFFPRIIRATKLPLADLKSKWQALFRYFFLGFALLWTTIMFFATYLPYHRHQWLARTDKCKIVEGPVEHFIPMPYTGHSMESFSVNGVWFAYSDYIVTDGFNRTSSHGGPINKDSFVRICYDPAGHQILRLEIRDFKGKLKDNPSSSGLFPKTGDMQMVTRLSRIRGLPWYGNFFVFIYFLDLAGFLMMFVPYLDTFFRLKTIPINTSKIREGLARRKKVKLRNTMLFWDDRRHAIWLRPRGLNLFQVQLTAAKFVTDELGKSIIRREIRYSSGFPLAMVLMMWTAYQMFSKVMPVQPHAPTAGQFVGLGAAMYLLVTILSTRFLASRMEKLAVEALSEVVETG